MYNNRNVRENPVMLVNSIARLLEAKMKEVNPEGEALPHSQRLIVMVVSKNEGISQLELSQITHLKPPTVSLGLKKLEEMGLIKKELSCSDMRVARLYLTDKGREFESRNISILRKIDREVLRDITIDEKRKVTDVLIKMRDNILEGDFSR